MNSPSIQSNVPHSRFAIVPPSKVLDFIDDTTLRQDIREVPIPRIDPAQEHAISALTGHHGSLYLALAG